MKKILILIALFVSMSAFSQKAKKIEKAVIQTSIYCDHCKACETCGKLFNDNIYDIDGLQMYELDEKAMTLTVYYNTRKTDLDRIRAAISKLGYDADDVKADPSAYEKLDGCCKKAD